MRYKGFKSKRKVYNVYHRSMTGKNKRIHSTSDLWGVPMSRSGVMNFAFWSNSGSGFSPGAMSNTVKINLQQTKKNIS